MNGMQTLPDQRRAHALTIISHILCPVEFSEQSGKRPTCTTRFSTSVMGVHGRGALDALVFGSNTARVTRAETCPVLVLPGGP